MVGIRMTISMTASEFTPTEVRYIKLGEGGRWAHSCIEIDGTVRLGYASNQHPESLNKEWDKVREYWLRDRNGRQGPATSDLRQIREFYELPSTTLWITFHNRLLYWCFADEKVNELAEDGSRVRKAIGGWSCRTLNGELLHVSNLDGRVSKVQAYKGTICSIEHADYLIRKIRCQEQPEVLATRLAFDNLVHEAINLINSLWWHDFELLADLIFSRSGWQRMSVLGKTEKDIDIDMLSPITNKRAFVQVKSSADLATLQDSINFFRSSAIYDEMYFVVHTPLDGRMLDCSESGITVVGPSMLANLTINAGLLDWLVKKHE